MQTIESEAIADLNFIINHPVIFMLMSNHSNRLFLGKLTAANEFFL